MPVVRKIVKAILNWRLDGDRRRLVQRMDESKDPASVDPNMWWRYGIGEPPDGWNSGSGGHRVERAA